MSVEGFERGRELPRSTMSVKEFCRFVGIGRTMASRLFKSLEVPSLKIGRRRLILIADAQAWLDRLRGRAA